jgi:hypothetical protein
VTKKAPFWRENEIFQNNLRLVFEQLEYKACNINKQKVSWLI